ncbi:rna-directed dna polymerase from mobile element jockey-like [Willisornis vidua]|uniref:Rna-directed dna polymerase from mobile element jockey-like n=1 Tax=Willisornis vidua TaxID=1566151 RepID=A0ABQ9D613_9PASS|nr:rna-directed dna polymerase from mobile element jockey-like [Willisornis vidua]
MGDNFLSHMIDSLTRGNVILDLIVINISELTRDVRIGSHIGCSGHASVEFTILRNMGNDPGNYQSHFCAWEDHETDLLEALVRHTAGREVIQDSQHGFTKGKSCLTYLVAFYDGVTTSVDKGRATDVIYLDFCKAFDTVKKLILLPRLETDGFNRWTVRWIRNWLDGCIQRAVVKGLEFQWASVMRGVLLYWDQFNIFINDKGIECTPNKFADDILSGAVDTPGGQDASRGTRTGLRSGPMGISCSLTRPSPRCCTWAWETRLGDEWIKSSPAETDLAGLVDERLDMTCQCSLAAQKVNHTQGCIQSSKASRSRETILPLYSSLGKCHLKLWGPQDRKDMALLQQA